jgi:hypothetical protein
MEYAESAVLGTLPDKKEFRFPFEGLKKHFIALGSSGSGKTVFCKALIEEAAKNNIPAIIVDPQGDIASLALGSEKLGNVEVIVFTPTSSKGIPLSINPLSLPKADLEKEDLISVISQISSSVISLLGYDLEKDKGKAAQSALYTILMQAHEQKTELSSFDDLAFLIESSKGRQEVLELVSEKELHDLVKKIRYLTVGEKELLFNFGVPLDIDFLLGRKEKKTRLSIIYLNTLEQQADKEFFVSVLATELYKWMLSNPSKDLQALFYIDEISTYIPAGALKPLPKPMLTLLFKQARKYGLGCIVSTQNPGDIEYKAFAQFGTWAVGRLTTRQDQAKVKDALKSLAGAKIEKVIEKLPKLKPGTFLVFSPDYFDDIPEVSVRWLLTEHKTLNEADVKLIADKQRDSFKGKIVEKKAEKKRVVEVEGQVITEKKEGKLHLPVNIGYEKAKDIAERKRKKKFLFGEEEKLKSVELVFRPLLKSKVKVIEPGFLKRKIVEYEVVFSGKTGDVLVFSGSKFRKLSGFSNLLGLTDAQIKALKAVGKANVSTPDVAGTLGITANAANKTLNELLKAKLLSYERKGSTYFWFVIEDMNIPEHVKRAASSKLVLADKKENARFLKEAVYVKDISRAIRSWFEDAELAEVETIYYPVYEAEFFSKGKSRTLAISAVTGGIL